MIVGSRMLTQDVNAAVFKLRMEVPDRQQQSFFILLQCQLLYLMAASSLR